MKTYLVDVTLVYEERQKQNAHLRIFSVKNPVCQHHKFWYFKFKRECLKEHVETNCKAFSSCREILLLFCLLSQGEQQRIF